MVIKFTHEIVHLNVLVVLLEPFNRHGVKSVMHVFNQPGELVLTIGQCPTNQRVNSFVISNSVGYGIMTFTSRGFLVKTNLSTFIFLNNFECVVE